MHHKTLSELSRALQDKVISSVELSRHFLARIEEYDKAINSFITISPELAMEQAVAADQLIHQGKASPLTGVPIAHKDIFCTKGIKTTCGSKMLDNFISPYDATIVKRLHAAHTVMLGKTNMDEFAMGSSNENSYYGAVKNPWNTGCVPGGSSGGSSAAVAARLVPAATGSDTGGSIRQPAAFSGVTGLKPTYGRVSRYGMIAFASSLDQAGVLTQSAEDAALLLNCMAGHDPLDSTSATEVTPDYMANIAASLKGMTVGLPKEYFGKGVSAEVAAVVDEAIRVFEQQGVKLVEVSLPHTALAPSVYYVIAPAECSSNLARYDGVRYGYRCEDPKDLTDLYERSRSEAFGQEVKRRVLIGTYVLSSGYYDAYYLKAQQVRRLILNDFLNVFRKVDVLLTPVTPTTPFGIGEKLTDPVSMYLSDVFTIAVNLAGLPAISLPAGIRGGLPIGVQLIGQHFAEAQLLNMGFNFQQVTDWHRQAPPPLLSQ